MLYSILLLYCIVNPTLGLSCLGITVTQQCHLRKLEFLFHYTEETISLPSDLHVHTYRRRQTLPRRGST